MVVAALTEQTVRDDAVDVELVEHGVRVLPKNAVSAQSLADAEAKIERTLLKLAVKTTIS